MKGSRPLSAQEFSALLAAIEPNRFALRDRCLLILGIRAGFRISELLSLRLRDVLQNGNLVDRVLVSKKNMKGKVEGREIALHKQAKEAIGLWVSELQKRGLGPESFLFQSREGDNRPMNRITAWVMLTKIYKKCGLTGKLGTHCMRKTFAKKVYRDSGNNIRTTQKLLGHSSSATTEKYLESTQEEMDDPVLKD